ncbi:hypothetical protein RI129_005636 [Pyrocoelia pectoralis]|uniref:Nuclear cap-binding protein subunit 3 n=1 Tax=Pyrocoelia pectoralis TaxID=417401 RepID=A0AAN7VEY7_9COLE
MATVAARPNIRIEIQNNLVEPMEVDENEKPETEFEDGEITDDTTVRKNVVTENNTLRTWNNKEGGFTTGVDIFNGKEHEKLQERANRFGLNPDEISNFTNDDLQKLHESLGISVINEKDIRFEAIHMRGTEEMSTDDVFEYFAKYGPTCIEWIDDESCNIVWPDKLSSARALHFTSKIVKGMPVDGPCDPFTKDDSMEPEEECRSILLSNKTRVIEIAKELPDSDVNDNEVSVSDISVPIPPGYWRRGIDHPKSKVLLLRFAFKTDRKPLKAERFSEYYKKYGNPNFGYLKGVISASCRNKFKGIFDRNKDIKQIPISDNKNPWGDLAENWDQDEQFSEQAYINETQPTTTLQPDTKQSTSKAEVLKRLGAKRPHVEELDISNDEVVKKVSKIPRMRMYADEEEVKIKRKKQLLQLKQKQSQSDAMPTNDLRNMISNNKSKVDPTEPNFENDLGSKLKNRKQKEEEKRKKLEVLRSIGESHKDRRLRHRSPSDRERRSRHKESSSHRSYDKSRYRSKMHSDRFERRRKHHSPSNEDVEYHKPKSKVAVVIKTQKRPTVASTVWSRITPKKERLKTASERLQLRRDSSSSSESSSADSSSSSSDSASTDSSSDSDEDSNDNENKNPETSSKAATQRPGFTNSASLAADRKSPLRIEISNDHFKEE